MIIKERNPVQVSTNGNCLFNSLSVDMCGNESLATRLRVLTCIEMVSNKLIYDTSKHNRLELVSPSYDEACKAAAKNRAFSSAWTILAAASVLGCPIQSVYPPRNGFMDKTVGILNTMFDPLQVQSNDPIVILWTSSGHGRSPIWTPDHFVPLVKASHNISVIDIDSMHDFPILDSTRNESNVCPTIFDTTVKSLDESFDSVDQDNKRSDTCHVELDNSYTDILETTEELEGYSVDLVKGFKEPELRTIGEGKLLEIGTRLTISNVQIKKIIIFTSQIGETQIAGRRRWRIISIENNEEEANVTLWSETVTIGDRLEVNAEINMNVCCVVTATFQEEKVFYSAPLIKFECKIVGHFDKVCKTKDKSKHGKIRQVVEQPQNNTDDEEYVFSMIGVNQINSVCDNIVVNIGNVNLKMIIDSGASCNIMGINLWNYLKDNHVKCVSSKSTKSLFAYGSEEPLKIAGIFTATVQCNNRTLNDIEFVVIEGKGQALLSRNTAEQLGVLQLVHSVSEPGTIKDKYPECFTGVGKLKSFQLQIPIDPDVEPIIQPMRRVPFNLRDKLGKKLDELLDLDIIEHVNEPSQWRSSISSDVTIGYVESSPNDTMDEDSHGNDDLDSETDRSHVHDDLDGIVPLLESSVIDDQLT
ncbi:unnamed protein product [Mytilus edulis]|uniref:OTU domain-containing protein n=1 Tax=Mytilus edulis TaxID=6550 RepID=A0A8S3U982_MYTED|nr:unnamed protein product [Mytilus edulis]